MSLIFRSKHIKIFSKSAAAAWDTYLSVSLDIAISSTPIQYVWMDLQFNVNSESHSAEKYLEKIYWCQRELDPGRVRGSPQA